jgi:ATP-dependent RNA helicase DHX36
MQSHPLLGDTRKVMLLPLHSSIPTSEQRRVFRRPPPGVVKIVLSTNIAETSLTIDDIVYVIDTGRTKEKVRFHIN